MRAAVLVVALASGGCQFDGGLGTGYLCPTGDCPPGQTCEDGVCTLAAGGADASAAVDGAPGGDGARSADAGVGLNLVDNPGIEDGLEPWTPYNAVLTASGGGHSGSAALEVCADLSGDFTVYQDVLKAPTDTIPKGQHYVGSFWVRAASSGPAPPTVMLTIRESGGVVERLDHDGPTVTGLADQWVQLQASGTVQESDRENLILIVWGLAGSDADCFAVDDAVLRAE